jgi:hypothetical protein
MSKKAKDVVTALKKGNEADDLKSAGQLSKSSTPVLAQTPR